MPLSAKTLHAQLSLMKPLLSVCSLDACRSAQNRVGELMGNRLSDLMLVKEHLFSDFRGAWIIPKDERRQGVLLYLHGGGFTCGDLEYAKGVGATLADQSGARVFCPAYRLAPEHPFPAALEDALTSYRYLLEKGYTPDHITLCGESAGGGLCYSLCMLLKAEGLPMPGGILALSPWTDLTASGPSYRENIKRDPSMTPVLLDYFASLYTNDRENPLVSPLFGDLSDMPPSLIFVGGDEVMCSDSQGLHEKLLDAGCKSKLVITPERWHAYILYNLAEDRKDITLINQFLDQIMGEAGKLRWMRLDNAAKIYPAARNQEWSNVFRLSMTLTELVDTEVLQAALDVTVRRFPSISARLRRGVFWYYLQQLEHAPPIQAERSYPLTKMSREQTRQCAFRVIVFQKRIAVEFFHSLTDGTGGMIFLKSLVAEYLTQKYGIRIPAQAGVLGRLEEPAPEELEDSFLRYSGDRCASRRENDAWRLIGTPEPDGFLHVTCLQVDVKAILQKAKAQKVTLTTFLCAVTMQALQELQAEREPFIAWRKPLKVMLPVNLRNLFPSRTLRNFALYTTPEIDPRLGVYSFEEICNQVHHHMGADITPKSMAAKIATNVVNEQMFLIKIMPLFLKNLVMKAVFNAVGERKSCLTLSNLGAVQLPEAMAAYVRRMDFILGVQSTAPYNCGVLSYGDTLYINFIRNTREPALEQRFFRILQDMGLEVTVCSNNPDD